MTTHTPVVLVVLDGWGLSRSTTNILRSTPLPTMEKLRRYYPFTALQASGISVGIPWGDAGNSEVGHMALGSGRIIYQNLPRITLAIRNGTFFTNDALIGAVRHVRDSEGTLHVMGLLSTGAVHSHYEHIVAMIELARREHLSRIVIHPFLDGRDSSPTDGIRMLDRLRTDCADIGVIGTVSGRHYAMDRNNNWDRTARAYAALTGDSSAPRISVDTLNDYIRTSYNDGATDEFIVPTVVTTESGEPQGVIRDGDAVVFINFREDRARQLTRAFTENGTDNTFVHTPPNNLFFVSMTQYDATLNNVHVAFPPQNITNTLGEVLSAYDKTQLRIAETEKYAHVTYFFNGGSETPFPGEDRVLIPSPNVTRFDEAPEMSAARITDRILTELERDHYDFILVNYANADMVGHTGNMNACRTAVQTIDTELGRLIPAVLTRNGAVLITADHGNVEELYNDRTGTISTAHSTNPVPLWYVTAHNHRTLPRRGDTIPPIGGLLSDVAPTILEILHLTPPREMDGRSLLPILRS